MKPLPDLCLRLRNQLIVSCQAPDGTPFRQPGLMAPFARAAVEGGAGGIRVEGAADTRSIRDAVSVPVIGISKRVWTDGGVLITPSVELAAELVQAGADMIAVECTARAQRFGALERIRRIRAELGVPVLADVATLEEGLAAAAAGAYMVLTTMRGYTPETRDILEFDAGFVAELAGALDVPVVAEGRIVSPEQSAAALEAGAFAVVIGGAITRPDMITRRFVTAMARRGAVAGGDHAIGIDLGSTNTKFALVDRQGRLASESSRPTPSTAGREAILAHLGGIVAHCLAEARTAGLRVSAVGIATGGWVDPEAGEVIYATGNLPGWTGTKIRASLEAASGLPVAVENDANSLAVAERLFGCAKDVDDFVCITLGTGVGGGCYVGGRLRRGAHCMGNAIGHIRLDEGGPPCTCGQSGCLEAYANAAALLRYAGDGFSSAEAVIRAAVDGQERARRAVRTLGHYLARGCAAIVHLLDPALIVISGGIARSNPFLLSDVEEELRLRVSAWERRRVRLEISSVAYYGGVIGAGAVALEKARA